MAISEDYIASLYRDILGREGTPDEIAGHVNNPGGEAGVRNLFMGSPEYAAEHNTAPDWHDVGGVVTYDTPQRQPASDGPQRQQTSDAPNYRGYTGAPAPIGSGGYGSAPASGGDTFNPTTANWNRLHGFSAANYYDPTMGSMKYQFARIAADYDPSQPGSLDRMFADPRFRAAFPNAKLVGKDSIDFGGQLSDGSRGVPVGVVDVGESFLDNKSGRAWQWLDQGSMGVPGGPTTTPGGGGGGGGTGPGSGGIGTNRQSQYVNLGQQFGPPGTAGINNGPLQQAGQDPLSQLITGALADFISRGGSTDFSDRIKQSLFDVIDGGGANSAMNARYESARELASKARRASTSDARANMAARGLLLEPGSNGAGVEQGVMRRIGEGIDEQFARTVRDIGSDEADANKSSVLGALQMATNLSQSEAANLLASIGEGTSRQTALAGIALQQLGQNMAWNEFLAQFGLDRDKTLYMLQNGEIDSLTQLMNQFMSLGSLLRGGYI